MIRCLFEAARHLSPAIIFLDEVDALLSARGGDGEHEASRRMKNEFFQQMDGLSRSNNDGGDGRVLVLAATNCPWDLDMAALRRLEKRVYVPLPDHLQRVAHFRLCITHYQQHQQQQQLGTTAGGGWQTKKEVNADKKETVVDGDDVLDGEDVLNRLAELSKGLSGADIQVVCREAAMAPMRRMLTSNTIDELQTQWNHGSLQIAQVECFMLRMWQWINSQQSIDLGV